MSSLSSFLSSSVDQAAKNRENSRRSVDLIQNHKLVFQSTQIQLSIHKLLSIGRNLKVKVNRIFTQRLRNSVSQCSFANLTRPQQRHCGKLRHQLGQTVLFPACNHAVIMPRNGIITA